MPELGSDKPRNRVLPTANKHPSDSNMVEFVVTLKSKDDLTAFYNDMENTSSITNIPDRKCECRIRRQLSRNTNYWLTREEATSLVNDTRVETVEEPAEAKGAWKDVDAWTQTSSKFAKSTDSNPNDINWAIARMREKTNPSNWGSPGTGSDSYDLTRTVVSELSGKNVDVVVMDDGGPHPNTLEYSANADGSGLARMIRKDWDDGRVWYVLGGSDYAGTVTAADSNRTAGTYSGIYPTGGSGSGLKVDVVVDSNGAVGWPFGSGSTTIVNNDASYGSLFKGGENYREGDLVTIPDSALGGGGAPDIVLYVQIKNYSYDDGHSKQEHGAHCTGNVAGNTQGWAKDANIYNLTYYDDPQYVLKFHKEKPINPETGRPNPTVMNNSWGYRASSWDSYSYRTKRIIYRGNQFLPLPAGCLSSWSTWSNIGSQTISNLTYNINVTAPNSSYYTLNGADRGGPVVGNNQQVDIKTGDTVQFNLSASGHPFFIKTAPTTGVGNQASGVTNNGAQNGSVSWTPNTAGTYYYICQYHPGMVAQINVTSNVTRTPGTYDVTPTGGTGSNAKFEVTVDSDGSINAYSMSFVKYDKPGVNYGTGYTYNDVLTIPDSQLGGGGAPDITFNVTGVGDDGTNNAIWSDETLDTVKMGTGSVPTRDSATDADFADLVNSGVVVIASAGNSDFYVADGPTDPDYNNKFILNDETEFYYHRGSSPGSAIGSNGEKVICVGAIGAHNDTDIYKTGNAVVVHETSGIEKTDYRAEFSNFGPRINIWAPGCAIQSTWRGDQECYTNTGSALDPRAAALGISPSIFNNFVKCMGTSMSGPNVCGMFACLAERYPHMTTKTAIQYVKDFCPDTVQTTNNGFARGGKDYSGGTYNAYYTWNRSDDTDLGSAYNSASCKANAFLVNHRNTETGGQAYPAHDSLYRTDSGTFAYDKQAYPRKTTKIYCNPPFTYALSKSGPAKLDNETDITVTLTTTNVPNGTKVPYVITSDWKDIGVRPYMPLNMGLMQIHDSTLTYNLNWHQPFTGMDHKKGKQWKINMSAAANPTAVDDTANLIPNPTFTSASSYKTLGGNGMDYGGASTGGYTYTLPWSIPIFGTNQTQTHWSMNGFVTFGSTADIDEKNALDEAKDILFFSAFAGGIQPYLIRGEVQGTAPNRVFSVNWYSLWAGVYGGHDIYFTFKENDKDHIYIKYADLSSKYLIGDKDETNMWPTYYYNAQRNVYFDESDGYFTVNNNTATTKLKKQFPLSVDNFNLILKLAHFGGEQITIPTDSTFTFRFYMDWFIQNTTGDMTGNSSWRVLPDSQDRRHIFGQKYTTNTHFSRAGRTIWMRANDTMIIRTTGGVGTSTIRLSETIGGAESSLVSNNQQDSYTFKPVTAGELWLSEPSQGTIHDAVRVFVYGKYDITFTSANTTDGYTSSGRDYGGDFTNVIDKDILLGIGDTLVINNQVSGVHPIRISESDVNTSPAAVGVTSETQSAYTFTPHTYGVWYYNCTAHSGMGGRIIVMYDGIKYNEESAGGYRDIDIKPHSNSHWEFGNAYANKMFFDGEVYQKTHTQKPFRMTIGDRFRITNQDSTNYPIIISDTSGGTESRDVDSNYQGNYFFAPQRIGSYFLRSTGSNPPPEIELVCEVPLYTNLRSN